MKSRITLVAAAAAATVLALTGCSSSTDGGSTDGETADGAIEFINAGKLTVCSDIPYEPFEFVKDGENVGFDLDIAARIAEDLEVELNVIDSNFDAISSGLFKTQCDIAISGISITEPRKENMEFSTPYLDDDLVLVAAKDSGIESLEDAKGQAVGVQQATTGEEYANEQGLNPTGYEDSGLQIQSLKSGQTVASLGNQSILRYAIKDDDSLTVVEEIKTGEQLGVAIRKGDTALVDAVDATLAEMESDGSMDELKKTWFGED